MCKYCQNASELIPNISNCPTDMYIEEELFTKDDNFFLRIVSKVNIGLGGNIVILTSAAIDYCPFCGRNLKGE